jgi:hypothetical protein
VICLNWRVSAAISKAHMLFEQKRIQLAKRTRLLERLHRNATGCGT